MKYTSTKKYFGCSFKYTLVSYVSIRYQRSYYRTYVWTKRIYFCDYEPRCLYANPSSSLNLWKAEGFLIFFSLTSKIYIL